MDCYELGGSGLYQVQLHKPHHRPWQNVAPPTASSATNTLADGTKFYRVQSLPNP